MRRAAFALALSAAVGIAGAAIADPATRLIEVIGEKQSEPDSPAASAAIQVSRKKPCGGKADAFFCGNFAHNVFGSPTRGSVKTPAIRVAAPKGAKVLVTWTGSVFCERYFARPLLSATEYVVYAQIQTDKVSSIAPNEDGSVGIGRKDLQQYANNDEESERFFDLHPITLTRTFDSTKSAAEDYFAVFDVDIRQGNGFCNVNGGAMTTVVVR